MLDQIQVSSKTIFLSTVGSWKNLPQHVNNICTVEFSNFSDVTQNVVLYIENITFSTNALLNLLMSAFVCKKSAFFLAIIVPLLKAIL